jgi:hypothetical protein
MQFYLEFYYFLSLRVKYVSLRGLVVILLATETKVRGFNPGQTMDL